MRFRVFIRFFVLFLLDLYRIFEIFVFEQRLRMHSEANFKYEVCIFAILCLFLFQKTANQKTAKKSLYFELDFIFKQLIAFSFLRNHSKIYIRNDSYEVIDYNCCTLKMLLLLRSHSFYLSLFIAKYISISLIYFNSFLKQSFDRAVQTVLNLS